MFSPTDVTDQEQVEDSVALDCEDVRKRRSGRRNPDRIEATADEMVAASPAMGYYGRF